MKLTPSHPILTVIFAWNAEILRNVIWSTIWYALLLSDRESVFGWEQTISLSFFILLEFFEVESSSMSKTFMQMKSEAIYTSGLGISKGTPLEY